MSAKVVNSLSYYTDWTIGHVHSGALGWVGFISFRALYCRNKVEFDEAARMPLRRD